MNFIDELNEPQREALYYSEGPLLILAGAGSGKTKVVTGKIAYLIGKGVWASSILAITFTNKAAKEMKTRVAQLIDEDVDSMWIGTFHGICLRILIKNIERIGYTSNFTIYDSSDQKTLVKECISDLNLNKDMYKESTVIGKISALKNAETSPKKYIDEYSHDFYEKNIGKIYELYAKKLKQYNALDFDDLLIKTVELLREYEDIRSYYENKFRYIFVDEYQDTNEIQYKLIKLLHGPESKLTVVGDNDQSIYQWRGADINNILNFERDFKDAKVILLEQNYRSTQNILNVANEVIRNNPQLKEKKLWSDKSAGDDVLYKEFNHSYDEERGVVNTIQQLIYKGYSYRDIAILYRTNAQSRGFEESLMREGIPYRILGGLRFYDRKEIKDVLAYLKVISNPNDDIALKRIINVPKRGIGSSTLDKLEEYGNKHGLSLYEIVVNISNIEELQLRSIKSIKKFANLIKLLISKVDTLSISELLDSLLFESQYTEELEREKTIEARTRVENVMEFKSVVQNFERENPNSTLADFINSMSLLSDADKTEEDDQGVSLMTVHSAKGLEFPIVFLVGMEEKLFPISRAELEEEIEEERRLCYVAVTRAEKLLFISSAKNRTLYGNTFISLPSRFIGEMNDTVVKDEVKPKYSDDYSSKLVEVRDYSDLKDNFKSGAELRGTEDKKVMEINVGDRVKHKKWGEGMIVSKTAKDSDYELTVAFDNKGIKKLVQSFAPLEIIR